MPAVMDVKEKEKTAEDRQAEIAALKVEHERHEAMLKDVLTPGPEHPEGKPVADLRPCGKCDGVIYLGKGKALEVDEKGETRVIGGTFSIIDVPSAEKRALRYLRPHAFGEMALRAAQRGANAPEIGISRPDIHGIISSEIRAAADAVQRPVEWMFRQDEKGISAGTSKHRSHWNIYQVEADIWAVLYE